MLNRSSVIIVAAIAVALGACGQRADLEKSAAAQPSPVPYGSNQPASAEELLEPTALSAPERSVELRRRSEEREDDPFDLPPEQN